MDLWIAEVPPATRALKEAGHVVLQVGRVDVQAILIVRGGVVEFPGHKVLRDHLLAKRDLTVRAFLQPRRLSMSSFSSGDLFARSAYRGSVSTSRRRSLLSCWEGLRFRA